VVLILLVAAALVGGGAFDAFRSKGLPDSLKQGHRRPLLFGLWQPGPRDRQDVQARFRANIQRYGPQWGEPVWENSFGTHGSLQPHDYIVEVPWSSGHHTYQVTAIAWNTYDSARLYIKITRPDLGVRGNIAAGWSQCRGDHLFMDPGQYNHDPEMQAAGVQIETALRDALE
jgi:hypothetical protein